MGKSNLEKFKKIEAFSDKYRSLSELEGLAFQEAGSWEKVIEDWWLALLFFFDRAFYQGRSDKLSRQFEQATVKALDTFLIGTTSEKLLQLRQSSDWLIRENWNKSENPLWSALGRTYHVGKKEKRSTGRQRDKEMVLDTLNFIEKNCEDCNILAHSIQNIKIGEIVKLSKQLDYIVSVGDKITSLFLRDIVFLYGLEDYLRPEDYCLVMPIDTWVRQVCDKLQIKPDAKEMVSACRENGVSPIKFNQGAWYLGARSFSILIDAL